MSRIFVSGHKNPDTDSVCSAYCYAALKNTVEADEHLAIRCGNLNRQARFVFDHFGLTPPPFVGDIYPKVADVMTPEVVTASADEPVMTVMRNIENLKIKITPVVDDDRHLLGIMSVSELTDFFLQGDITRRPEHHFLVDNFAKVMEGYLFRTGKKREFTATVMIGAMPFERFKARMNDVDAANTVLIVGKRRDIVEYAIEHQLPALVLTGMGGEEDLDFDWDRYEGSVFVSRHDTAETLRRLWYSTPVKSLMAKDVPVVSPNDDLADARSVLISIEQKGMAVVEDDRLVGIITRSDLIKDVNHRLIMMDHNELSQAVDGAETAEVIEIVDHHRLAAVKTRQPITFYAKPVGSTCTLVFERYRAENVEIDRTVAGLLLAGILSDTVILKSPTTTDADRRVVKELAAVSGIDPQAFGIELFSVGDSLKAREPESVVTTDFKPYDEHGRKVGIGQVEVVNIEELTDAKTGLASALDAVRQKRKLDWAMLLVTDIIREESMLLTAGDDSLDEKLSYRRVDDGQYHLPGVLSRKKQLLPEVLRVLELAGQAG